jgi:hypothetical protein
MGWFRHGALKPQYVMVVCEDEGDPDADGNGGYGNPYTKTGFTPNYLCMRFSLASTLLDDGYYSYEIIRTATARLGSCGLTSMITPIWAKDGPAGQKAPILRF